MALLVMFSIFLTLRFFTDPCTSPFTKIHKYSRNVSTYDYRPMPFKVIFAKVIVRQILIVRQNLIVRQKYTDIKHSFKRNISPSSKYYTYDGTCSNTCKVTTFFALYFCDILHDLNFTLTTF